MSDCDKIASRIQSFLEEVYPHQGMTLDRSTDLLNGWFVDSLGIVQTVVFLEEHFGIDVQAADVNVQNFHSIDTIAAYVAKHIVSRRSESSDNP